MASEPISDEPAIAAGSVATMTVWARVFSMVGNTHLVISDRAEEWGSNSAPLYGIESTQYEVTRAISEDASEVQFGIDWDVSLDNAWLELREMEVTLAPGEAAGLPTGLWPTDTPTVPVTPTEPAILSPTDTPTPAVTPTPLQIIVTSTPTPVDIYEAATRVAVATDWAQVLGPATETPEYQVTATPTPTPIVVTNTPTPGNKATTVFAAQYATLVAVVTGTPTPLPEGAVVLVATVTPTRTPRPAAATKTPTPIFRYVADINFPTMTPTPVFPEEMVGKILFLSDYLGTTRQPKAFMINPDGTGLALLSSRAFYDRAKERDAYSADKRYYAYSLSEPLGDREANVQIYYDDYFYNSTGHQLTYFGFGKAWSPTWSPADDSVVALVSNDTKNDEIWIAHRNEYPAQQITHNDWQWDKSPSFSPDGTQIVFESNRVSGTRQLWIMDISGASPHQITWFPYEAWDPVWVKYADS